MHTMTTSHYEFPMKIQKWQKQQWKILLDQGQKSQALLRQLEDLERQAAVSNTPGQPQEEPSKARKRKFGDDLEDNDNLEEHQRLRRWCIWLPLQCFCPVIKYVATDGE